MLMRVLFALGLIAFSTGSEAAIDCRIRAMPPAQYSAQALPGVKYKGMQLADLQRLFRKFAGLPTRAPGLDYCSDPIGFVYPWDRSSTPTIYYPTDVTDRCQREVIAHEEAHVAGWPTNHPGARIQEGPCKARSTWPKTASAP